MSVEKEGIKIWRSYEARQSGNLPEEKWEEGDEFSKGVRDLIQRGVNANLKRKSFLTLMGASISMVATSCARKPVEKIVPYFQRPMNFVLGNAVYYATARVSSKGVSPVLVKTQEGKPNKIEGHSGHPVYKGAVSADTIATIWDLYDPDRAKNPAKGNAPIAWDAAYGEIKSALAKKTAILTGVSYSPSEKAAVANFAKKYSAATIVYDAAGTQRELLNGAKLAFGKSFIPSFRVDKANLILSVDADFLGSWLSPELFTKQFSSRRTADKSMNRLISLESNLTLTGSNADTRYAINSGSQLALLLSLAYEVGKNAALSAFAAEKAEASVGIPAKDIKAIAAELTKNKGKSLVLAGSINARSGKSGEVAAAAYYLNDLLANIGLTVDLDAPMLGETSVSSDSEMAAFIADLAAGKYETVVIDRVNPVFEFPEAAGFAEAIKKAKTVVYIGDRANETGSLATYLLPASHYLESWSDGLSYGVYSVVQPAIRPLADTREAAQILRELSGETVSSKDAVAALSSTYAKTGWEKLLGEGFAASVNSVSAKVTFPEFSLKAPAKAEGYRLSLYESVQIGDGSGGNISFRHELPDPVSKVTWDNYVAVSPADSKVNGWKTGDFLKLTAGKVSVTLPVFVQPGLKAGNMAAAIGYGHTSIGKVGNKVGKNAMAIAGFQKGDVVTAGIAVAAAKSSKEYKLVSTQKHHEMAIERGIVRQATLSEFLKNPKAGHQHEEIPHFGKAKGLYKKHKYEPHKWSLAIDLNKCTGCSACVVSCYSENNVPAVGKKEIDVGAEMSWLRIDRYYGYWNHEDEKHDETMENPEVFFMPVMCQHCDNAPCENVCPVGATAHSDDGLNYMTYNQCIGTRYCANDCPFKVRRFNWFENWEGKLKAPQQFALNPDVTVRSKGVIEKCSMCQQRISDKRQQASVEGRELKDGEIMTACQQACPADAITFGNINDEQSMVSKQAANPRAYKLFAAVNVESVVSYMVRIKNKA